MTKNLPFKKSIVFFYGMNFTVKPFFVTLTVWCMLIIGVVAVKEHTSHLCDPNVKQHSGYIKINEKTSLFFWFFESRNHPKTSPLTLWLSGGPGCSSMTGLFQELGPCKSLIGGSDVKMNPESWNKVSNMLFVDQPAGAGFSFGDKISTTKQSSQDLYIFLQKFFEKFSEYSTLDFHIFGESYGGHYVPSIAKLIDENNILIGSNKMKAITINLRSIGIGNGLIDPKIQITSFPDFMEFNSYGPLLNSSVLAVMRSQFPECDRLINECYITGNLNNCISAQEYCRNYAVVFFNTTGLNQYDIRASNETTYAIPPHDYVLYLAKPEIMAAIGAQKKYDGCSNDVEYNFYYSGDLALSYKAEIEYLLDRKFPVLLYYGDTDYICNWFGGKELAMALNWFHKYEFTHTPIKQWLVDNKPAGEFISFNKLTFIRVYEAGHKVPYYQPKYSLDMFNRWINNEKLLTIKTKRKKKIGIKDLILILLAKW